MKAPLQNSFLLIFLKKVSSIPTAYRSVLPIVAAVLFILTLFALLVFIHRHDVQEHSHEFKSNSISALDSLELHFLVNAEFLALLASEYSHGLLNEKEFKSRAEDYMTKNPAISEIFFINKEGETSVFFSPLEKSISENEEESLSKKIDLLQYKNIGKEPALTGFNKSDAGGAVFLVASQIHAHSDNAKYIGALYKSNDLIKYYVPQHVLEKNMVSLVGDNYETLATIKEDRGIDRLFKFESELKTIKGKPKLVLERYSTNYFSLEVSLIAVIYIFLSLAMSLVMRALIQVAEEREEAQKVAQIERDNLVNVFEAMEDGVAVVRENLDIEYVNTVLIRDFGFFAGRKCYEYFHGNRAKCVDCMMDEVIAGKSVHSEGCYPQNGRTYELTDSRVKRADGTASKLKIFRDITDRVESEKALKKSKDALRVSLESEKKAVIEARQRLNESESLARVTTALLHKITQDEALEVVCAEAQRLTGATFSAVLLRENEELKVSCWVGDILPHTRLLRLKDSFAGATLAKGEVQHISDVSRYDLSHHLEPRPEILLLAPLMVSGQAIGVLEVSRNATDFTGSDERIISQLANQAAIAIQTARLHFRAEYGRMVEERHRLARDLHDSVTQALYSIGMFTDAAQRAMVAKRKAQALTNLEELRKAAREAMLEMRLLIFELHPPAVEGEGLVGALKTRLSAVESRGGIAVNLEVEGNENQLTPEVVGALYRVAQEALNNSIKHAGASSVKINLAISNNALRLTISDDGHGFIVDKALTEGGMGLRSMFERVKSLGGEIEINSAPEKGTVIEAVIPILIRERAVHE